MTKREAIALIGFLGGLLLSILAWVGNVFWSELGEARTENRANRESIIRLDARLDTMTQYLEWRDGENDRLAGAKK